MPGKRRGVTEAAVNLASEKVTVVFDPSLTKPQALIDRIERAGYRVPTATMDLPITGMTCANCSAAVERTLNTECPVLWRPSSTWRPKRRPCATYPARHACRHGGRD
jgi:copper chaperone CopZ